MATSARGGVFRRSELSEWGVDPRLIPVMLRRQWWVRLHHGVYVDRDLYDRTLDPLERHLLNASAALLAIQGPAYLFGTVAAHLHHLPFDRSILDRVQVVRPLGTDSRALRRRITASDRLEPVVVHQHVLTESDVREIRGLATVSRELAAVSTAALSTPEWAVVTLDAACWQSAETLARIEAVVQDWPRLRGIGTVRRALPLVRTGAQTPLESLSRLAFIREGLPEPSLQAPLHDADGLIGYADMLWDEYRVVGEADGALKYTGRDVLVEEKRREDRIRAQGFVVVRWTWDEILRTPRRVAERVRSAATGQSRIAR